jgi:hypothetical protein
LHPGYPDWNYLSTPAAALVPIEDKPPQMKESHYVFFGYLRLHFVFFP